MTNFLKRSWFAPRFHKYEGIRYKERNETCYNYNNTNDVPYTFRGSMIQDTDDCNHEYRICYSNPPDNSYKLNDLQLLK